MTEPVAASQAVANRVRELRQERGWSQAELTRRLVERRDPEGRPIESDMPRKRAAIAKLERGERGRLSIEELLTLAGALDTSPVDLLTGGLDDGAYVVVAGWGVPVSMLRGWLVANAALPIQDHHEYEARHRWARQDEAERFDQRVAPVRDLLCALVEAEREKPEPDAHLVMQLRLAIAHLRPELVDLAELASYGSEGEGHDGEHRPDRVGMESAVSRARRP